MQPIHVCAQFGHDKLFTVLCDKYSISPSSSLMVSIIFCHVLWPEFAVTQDGSQPIHIAAHYGQVSILRVLATKYDIDPEIPNLVHLICTNYLNQ